MAATSNGRHNGLYTYDLFSGHKKESETHFLWWCAGAHQSLLKNYASEHAKYAGLGGVILYATFVLATLSGGYALYSDFSGNPWMAIVFGIIWGCIIFNLDRFLVSTIRKYGLSKGHQLRMIIPRIILALLIGVTIARPLEMKIFEKEIDTKVVENRHQKILLNDSLLQQENRSAMASADMERNRLGERKHLIEDSLRQLQQAYIREADGTGGSMQRGIEGLTLLKQEAYRSALQRYSPELDQLARQSLYQDSLLSSIRAGTEAKRKLYESGVAANVGFLERNKALSDLSGQESSVFWATLLISMLIILIEIAPVLSKLILHAGPYDVALAKDELMQMAASEHEMRKDKVRPFEKGDEWQQRQKEMSGEIMDRITELQKKYIHEELDKWERGERNNHTRPSLDELSKKIKQQYQFNEENIP